MPRPPSSTLTDTLFPYTALFRAIITRNDPYKDVDGFYPVNAGRLATGLEGFVPCTPLGCLMLLKNQLGDLTGTDAVVAGRSNIVGKPMAALLITESCTVQAATSRTRVLPGVIHCPAQRSTSSRARGCH